MPGRGFFSGGLPGDKGSYESLHMGPPVVGFDRPNGPGLKAEAVFLAYPLLAYPGLQGRDGQLTYCICAKATGQIHHPKHVPGAVRCLEGSAYPLTSAAPEAQTLAVEPSALANIAATLSLIGLIVDHSEDQKSYMRYCSDCDLT